MGALLLDTGYRSEELHDLKAMGELAAVPVHEILRLEAVAEAVLAMEAVVEVDRVQVVEAAVAEAAVVVEGMDVNRK